jgi:hypothetical protein
MLDDYLRFLYHIGEQSLPRSFIPIAKRLQQGDPAQMLRKGNTVYLLEVLLQRYVYGKPLELKSQSDLRDAVLLLLDMLVEQGSSAAFRMRDDFVTPMSPQLSVGGQRRKGPAVAGPLHMFHHVPMHCFCLYGIIQLLLCGPARRALAFGSLNSGGPIWDRKDTHCALIHEDIIDCIE